ncbi:ERF family protein [Brevibacillus laterosporus]|uniref:ERF family protein n=1 Tax=Brevibacillus laterosporus TaxID=1465 RepID=UPI00215B9970|nr:ERF family protein [Brevibacillus laterosporus]MCR8994512.1 ERF family protein [Brevibacillus laterosporus]
MSEQPRSLVKKLTTVMQNVKYIQKRGYNKFHNYNYATEADVAEKVREVLADQNVIMIPNMVSHSIREHVNAKGKTEYIATVQMEFKFYDGDSGEELVFHMFGEGQDAGDKATYKAITGAQKYALMKAFMIPTGDDPENDSEEEQNNSGTEPANMKATPNVKNSKEAVLKAKWQLVGYSLDNFDEWHQNQIERGYNENQMEAYLTRKIKEREAARSA